MKNAKLYIDPQKKLNRISPEIYGQFSEHLGRCIYDGIYVGKDSEIPNINGLRKDVIEALREIHIPVLRWPGGCFADEYHWKDGIGPKESRRKMINSNWGGVVEDNSFGTHEFMELCGLLGCEPYIAINMGSGTVREAAEWIEYLTADGVSPMAQLRKSNGREKPWKVKYIGVGNESWGCGGSMSADYYANEYKKYQCFLREYSENKLYKIACGPNADDYGWTKELMSRITKWHAHGISLHYYTLPGSWEHKGSATDFTDEEYYTTISRTLEIENIINGHLAVMDELDPERSIDLIIDEWGAWYDVEPGTNPGFLYQQNTMRDALIAAVNLNIFNKHSDRISMANIAQAVNVLQAMLLTEEKKLIKTPTYEIFKMYREHQGAYLIDSRLNGFEAGKNGINIPALSQSASIHENNGDKILTLTLSNASLSDDAQIEINLEDKGNFCKTAQIALLHNDVRAYNSFDNPDLVKALEHTETWSGNKQNITLPACSVLRVNVHVE